MGKNLGLSMNQQAMQVSQQWIAIGV